MFPILAPEMALERVEQLRREAREASGRPRAPLVGPTPGTTRRLASPVRIVSAGFRLLAGAVEGR
ncbi:MAG: hypothetical protein ACRDHS_00235 [Actinomycetota bacterium]